MENLAMLLHHFRHIQRLLCLPLLLLTLFPSCIFAGTLVSGRFAAAGGQAIVLSLSIQTDSPANLIIEQYMSGSNRVLSTSPQAKKIDGGGSTIKWLFRNVQTGSINMTTQLAGPLSGSVSAVVRFRNPDNGQITEIHISSS